MKQARVVDEDSKFVSGRAAVLRCDDSTGGWQEMNADTVDEDNNTTTWAIPSGAYCVGLISIDFDGESYYLPKQKCHSIEVVSGQHQSLTIPISTEALDPRYRYEPFECKADPDPDDASPARR